MKTRSSKRLREKDAPLLSENDTPTKRVRSVQKVNIKEKPLPVLKDVSHSKKSLVKKNQNVKSSKDDLSKQQLSGKTSNSDSTSHHSQDSFMDALHYAKSTFRTGYMPKQAVGREQQEQSINSFLNDNIMAKASKSLYISGSPGCGKTMLVESILRRFENNAKSAKNKQLKVIKLNCMICGNNVNSIWEKLASVLGLNTRSSGDDAMQLVKTYLTVPGKSKQFVILMLDEVDQLINQNAEILFNLFSWIGIPLSRYLLIGIANSIDLSERLIARLQALNCAPTQVAFSAYSASDIKAIITGRLNEIKLKFPSAGDLFHPAAIELCARKVAVFGDFRRALDLCRMALEMLELECNDGDKENASTFSRQVGIQHMVKVIDRSFGSVNASVKKLKELSANEKAVLAVLASVLFSDQPVETSMLRTYEIFKTLCNRQKTLNMLSRSEYVDMIMSLENAGLIEPAKKTANALGRSLSNSSTPFKQNKVTMPSIFNTPSAGYKSKLNTTPQSARAPKTPSSSRKRQVSILDPSVKIAITVSEKDLRLAFRDQDHLLAVIDEGVSNVVNQSAESVFD
ncbi:hypothetical protein MIR68_010037 [Amoeboaphelidium protococcarum]|nr:hypothetical protein MIR68_010037 [Amoeboaphelidium protococcarum]